MKMCTKKKTEIKCKEAEVTGVVFFRVYVREYTAEWDIRHIIVIVKEE